MPKGYRGIQQEVAGPGRYYLNRRAYIAYIIDTTNITIDWDNAHETRFDPLKVISKDGFPIDVSVKVVVRVRPGQAPYMVSKIGSIDNLILHVIHPMIDSSFRNRTSSTSAMNFMQDRQEEQRNAEQTRIATEKTRAEANQQMAIKNVEGEGESLRLKAQGEAAGAGWGWVIVFMRGTPGRAPRCLLKRRPQSPSPACHAKTKVPTDGEDFVN